MATPRKPAARTRAAKKPAGTGKVGRPRIPFDGTDSDKVRLLARAGTRHEVIASMLGCSADTLTRRFAGELAEGLEHANALVAASLFDRALRGDTASAIWWDKTRGGQRDTARHEHTGADGAPIELKNLGGMTDDQLDLLERAAALLAGPGAPVADGQPEGDPL